MTFAFEHLAAQPEVGFAAGLIAVDIFVRKSDAQLVGKHPVIAWAALRAFAFRYQTQIDVADGAIDDFGPHYFFGDAMLAATALQFRDQTRHDANGASALLEDGTIPIKQ